MKKYAKIITAILIISMLSLALFACVNPDSDKEGKMTLVLLDGDNAKEYVVDLSKLPSGNSQTGLISVLEYLQNDGRLTYSIDGTLLTQVGDLKNDAGANKWVWLYTDVEKDINVTEFATQITYKGKTYTDSGLGANLMSIKDGCTIIITYMIFG
ncbi:MAG: hypothetical protein K2L70_05595 [Clostridia bacterium]|nr:hypothetical protein [Clostridia bacterium]